MLGKFLWLILLVLSFAVSQGDKLELSWERIIYDTAEGKDFEAFQKVIQQDINPSSSVTWSAFLYSTKGEWDKAKQAYEQAKSLNIQLNLAWFPPKIPTKFLAECGSLQAISLMTETLWQSPLVSTTPLSIYDPKHSELFPYITFIYGWDEQPSRETPTVRQWIQCFQQSDQIPPHMQQIPAIFALALRWFTQRLGTNVTLPVRLWVFPKGNGDAFTVNKDTFFYGIVPDDRWQWWLKASHEAGHHAIPAFGPFSGTHEPYTGGFVGERLFALWLWEMTQQTSLDEVARGLRVYLRQKVVPEIVSAQQRLLAGDHENEPPMSIFLGTVCYIERSFGVELLRDVMVNVKDGTWKSFQNSIADVITKRLQGDGLTLQFLTPDANTNFQNFNIEGLRQPLKSNSWQLALWLPQGDEFQSNLLIKGNGSLKMRLGTQQIGKWQINSNETVQIKANWTTKQSGWQRIRFWWEDGDGELINLTISHIKSQR